MTANESVIRDKLARSLELLEPGLTLLEIEKYLPNPSGTRGFVDLLARDARGKFVLIELKRSSAASRDAAHEILKYVEGMKVNLAVREDELRLFVVSTDWSELLVPFSSLLQRTTLAVTGYGLTVDQDGTPLAASLVAPLPLFQDRLFMASHEVSLYASVKSRQRGMKSYVQVCEKKGIKNYVLVELQAADRHREFELASVHAAMTSIRSQFGAEAPNLEDIENSVPSLPYMLYFAMLQMDSGHCHQRISSLLGKKKKEIEEFESYLADFETKHKSGVLHEKLLEVRPWPHRDYLEIGYPAKFLKIVDQEKWNISSVFRFGTLSGNALLSDKAILRELRGEQGVTQQRYVRELVGCDPAEAASLSKEIERCLEDNPIWKSHFSIVTKTLCDASETTKINISLLNPSNILLSIYLLHARPDGILYQPNYSIVIEASDTSQMIFGVLEKTGKRPSLSAIIRDYYDNDPGTLLSPLIWGGYEVQDAKIVRDIGLAYSTYKITEVGNERVFAKLTEFGWEECAPIKFMQTFVEYLEENQEFVEDVCDFFAKHWNGFMTMCVRDDDFVFRT